MTDISVTISDDPVSVSVSNAPGPSGASSFFKGVAAAWPPTATPTAGWIYTLPDPVPAGTPAGFLAGYGAQWDGIAWNNIGPVRGPAGPAGPQGAAGIAGSPGVAGANGTAATITVGSVTTGAAGTSASVVNAGTTSAAVLNITIPRGDAGAAGSAGAAGPQGPQGPAGSAGSAGAAATVSVGTVTTGAAGSSASVTNVGTSAAAVLDITIPRGDTGAAGVAGPAGAAGVAGPQGPAGVAGATGPAGSSGVISVTAPLTNSGTSTAAVLGIDLTAPGPIGGTTPAAGTFTVLAATSRANLPSGAAGSPAARDLYAVANTLRYRDSTNTERMLLNSADNLANLGNIATARTNIDAQKTITSGTAAPTGGSSGDIYLRYS